MELNLDCLRAVILHIEEHQHYETLDLFGDGDLTATLVPIALPKNVANTGLAAFEKFDIAYCCAQAIASGLLSGEEVAACTYMIRDITPYGHEFLAALKNDNVWKQVKGKISKLGSISLPILIKLGADTLMNLFLP